MSSLCRVGCRRRVPVAIRSTDMAHGPHGSYPRCYSRPIRANYLHGSVGIRHADAGWTAALLTSRHCQVSRSQPTKFFISHQQTTRHDGLEKPLVPIAGVLPIHRRVFGSYSRALNASAIRWEQAEVSSFHRLRCNRLRQTRIARPLGESSNIRCRTTGCKRRTHVCQT